MKTSMRRLALALFLAAPGAYADQENANQENADQENADQASARAKLAEAEVAFTPEAFLDAAASGNVELVGLFLDAGMDPAVKNPLSQTALWQAVEYERLDVLHALLARGVVPNDVNAPMGAYGKTIVMGAVDTGEAAFVRALVEAGADAKKANDYEMPPLAEAARIGNVEMCQILLAAGADANAAPAGFPLIYGPVNEDHPEVVKLLLEAGAKLGEHEQALLEAAKTPEMRALLENAE